MDPGSIANQSDLSEQCPQLSSHLGSAEESSSSDLSLDCVTRTSNKRKSGEHPLIKLDTNSLIDGHDNKDEPEDLVTEIQNEQQHLDVKLTPQSVKETTSIGTNTSPAVIEMVDSNHDENGFGGQNEDLLEIQEELSEAISSAVRETDEGNNQDVSYEEQHSISVSEPTKSIMHINRNDTEEDGNLITTKKRKVTPDLAVETKFSNCEQMTPVINSLESERTDVFQHLQEVFHKELKNYEQYINSKNEQLEEYRKLASKTNEKLRVFNESLDEQKLKYSNLLEEFEVFKATQATRDLQLKHQKSHVEKLSLEKTNLEEKASKFKARLSETRNEVKMLNQNSRILQEKFQSQIEENESLKKEVNDLKQKSQQLQYRLNEISKNDTMLKEKLEDLQKDYTTLNEENRDLNEECKHKNEELSRLRTALEEKDAVAAELQANIRIFQDARQQSSKYLEERVEELTNDKQKLIEDLDKSKEYENKFKENDQKLRGTLDEITILNNRMDSLQNEIFRLQKEKDEVKEKLEASQQTVESVNDQLAIKSAEVVELTHDIEELKQAKSYIEDSIKARENTVLEWKTKYDEKCDENKRLSVELESVQFKNTNIEAEHLADLEQLHQEMTSLKDNLKVSSDQIKSLSDEKHILTERIVEMTAKEQALQGQLMEVGSSAPEENLHKKIEELQQKIQQNEAETNQKLQLLAEDLYIQYSSKHEQKVKMLKRGYESKYQEKMEKLELESAGLKDELALLKNQLQAERNEKQELLKLLNS
ncbi:LAFE_0G10550g1_1 [Lachancea fermentati]|uniref:LAFE_0G10550g1_1 n=1 Tax=Lachancea fermentati TaxID=4955 RepID=A0A1G4MHX3_LACFM|nr:LAFE_0G10550g1_1 [Lachancea fermentati]